MAGARCQKWRVNLRGGHRFDDDILDLEGLVGDPQLVPRERLVPRVVDLPCGAPVVGDHNHRAVVSVLVNVRALSYHVPREPRVAGEEGVHLVLLCGELPPNITSRHHQSDGSLR